MKFVLLSLLFFSTTLYASKINIAVAANLSYVMPELKKSFALLHPDITVQTTIASSGVLTAQIKNGARYGLFLSANMKYPNYLYKEGYALLKPKLYAQGSLALFSRHKIDCTEEMHCLNAKEIHKIAIGNPKTVPYGKAALQALKNANLYEKLKDKLVFAESISQTLSYALTAVDVGVIAKSSLFTSKMRKYKENINWIDIDAALYTPINQGMLLLKIEKNKEAYQLFYQFLQSSQAKKVFTSFGYKTQ